MFQKPTPAPSGPRNVPPPSGTPAPSAPVGQAGLPPANADLQTLQNALTELRIQEAGLQAQWNSLRDQVGDMRLDNPARPQIQQQLADVGTQLAKVRGDVAVVRGRIAKQTGRYVGETGQPNQPPARRGPDLDMVFGMSLGIIMMVSIPLSIAYARRIWRGKPAPGIPRAEEIPGRLERLEHAVDTIAIEVERISEGQRFMTKIMAERPAQQPTAGEDGRPILALGAGPIEPVRAAERQGVKQSVTPH